MLDIPEKVSGLPILDIPDELIKEMLSQIPVKSLLRLRCTCKRWREIIDSPSFIDMHRKRCELKVGTIEVIHRCNLRDFYSVSLDLNGIPTRDAEQVPPPFGSRYDAVNYRIDLLGFCNGVLCFVDSEHHLIFWNYSARTYFEAQYQPIHLPKFADSRCLVTYGFGYDDIRDDLKVVRLISACNDSIAYPSCHIVEVYHQKSDSWERFEDIVGLPYEHEHGILLGGALHWLRCDDDEPIVAFDLIREEFDVVPMFDLPIKSTLATRRFRSNMGEALVVSLGNFQDRLCLFCQYNGDVEERCILWVMMEKGVKESWVKLFSLNDTYRHVRPIYRSRRDRTVVVEKNKHMLKWWRLAEPLFVRDIETCCAGRSVLDSCYVPFEGLVGLSWNQYNGDMRRRVQISSKEVKQLCTVLDYQD